MTGARASSLLGDRPSAPLAGAREPRVSSPSRAFTSEWVPIDKQFEPLVGFQAAPWAAAPWAAAILRQGRNAFTALMRSGYGYDGARAFARAATDVEYRYALAAAALCGVEPLVAFVEEAP